MREKFFYIDSRKGILVGKEEIKEGRNQKTERKED